MGDKIDIKARKLLEKGRVDLYAKDTPRWILEGEDTLIWAGVGGEVTMDLKEIKNAVHLAERVLKELKKLPTKTKEENLK